MSLHDDLKAYLDGELDSVRADEVRVALTRDPALRRELAELESVSRNLQAYANEITPRGLEKTLDALSRARGARNVAVHRWVWGGGFAAAAVLLGIALIPLISSSHHDDADVASPQMVAKMDAKEKSPDVADASAGERATNTRPQTVDAPIPSPKHGLDKAKASPTRLGEKGNPAWANAAPANRVAGVPPMAPTKNATTYLGTGNSSFARSRVKVNLSSTNALVAAPASTGTIATTGDRTVELYSRLAPETVVLNLASKDVGTQQVLAIVGKFEVTKLEPHTFDGVASPPQTQKTIVVDLPEEEADKIIESLRALQPPSGLPTNAAMRGGFGGGGRSLGGTPPVSEGMNVKSAQATGGKNQPPTNVRDANTAKNVGRAGGAFGAPVGNMSTNSDLVDNRKKAPDQKGTILSRDSAKEPVRQKNAGGLALAKKIKTRRVIIVISEKPK